MYREQGEVIEWGRGGWGGQGRQLRGRRTKEQNKADGKKRGDQGRGAKRQVGVDWRQTVCECVCVCVRETDRRRDRERDTHKTWKRSAELWYKICTLSCGTESNILSRHTEQDDITYMPFQVSTCKPPELREKQAYQVSDRENTLESTQYKDLLMKQNHSM